MQSGELLMQLHRMEMFSHVAWHPVMWRNKHYLVHEDMARSFIPFTFFHMVAVLFTWSMAYETASNASLLCSADTAIITLASLTGTTLSQIHRCQLGTRCKSVSLCTASHTWHVTSLSYLTQSYGLQRSCRQAICLWWQCRVDVVASQPLRCMPRTPSAQLSYLKPHNNYVRVYVCMQTTHAALQM